MLTPEQIENLKPGDLVRHVPTGCVALYALEDIYSGYIPVEIPNELAGMGMVVDWLPENCELVED